MHNENRPRRDYAWGAALIIGGVFGVWLFIVLLSGAGWNVTGLDWDFERTGQLGDSFGFLSALMATFAAMFAYNALAHERTESARLRAREITRDELEKVEAQRLRRREEDRDLAEQKREAEGTFFRLITLRNSIVADLTTRGSNPSTGTDALEKMYDSIRSHLPFGESPETGYKDSYAWFKNDLGHYFRFTYHLIKFVDDKFKTPEEKYEYVRLLRAQLSNAEQGLIALNCAYGGGKGQFKVWVEQYSLLHNLAPEDRYELEIESLFEPSAFDPRH